jgi:RNA-directed DNA polymerase
VEAAQHALRVWRAEIGLEFKPSKTRLTHTLHEHQGQVGLDFLGCTIRQFPVGKTRTGRTTSGQPLGFTTRITPSKEASKRHTADLGTVIRHPRTVSQDALSGLLTPKIRGWAAYYRAVGARAAYATCDCHLYEQLRRWTFRRHPTKGRRWIVHRYWRRSAPRRGPLATANGARLRYHTDTTIRRHVQVRGTAAPFDGNLS